jgi:hypothetical protein
MSGTVNAKRGSQNDISCEVFPNPFRLFRASAAPQLTSRGFAIDSIAAGTYPEKAGDFLI